MTTLAHRRIVFAHPLQHGAYGPLTYALFAALLLALFTAVWMAFAFAMFSASRPAWEQFMMVSPTMPH